MDDLSRAKREWQERTLKPLLERYPERKTHFETLSGIPVDQVYLSSDVEMDELADLGMPGEYPFTRGVYPSMYRGRLWTMRQYAGFGSAQESNVRYRYLLAQGQTGLSVAFDLPTQLGYDADDPLAQGEVGRVGVSASTLDDIRTLFMGIPLDQVSISMTINAPAAILLAMVVALAKERGTDLNKLRGTVQNDILKEYVARGLYIFPPHPSMRLVADLMRYGAEHLPRWNTISVSGYHIREAGATAVQEVAFTLANAITYVQTAIQAGLDVDAFGPRLSFFFSAHNDFLEEIAKFRAARRLWARIMRERFGARSPRAWTLRFHTQTAGGTLTAQQPENNVVRVALQALAAVLGGTQSLHTNSRDEALWLPTENSARIALRTQQIIAHESGVTSTVDPFGGSYFMEYLTTQIERGALDYIDQIGALGGALRAIEQGYLQQEIADAAYQHQQAVERDERVIVGVNAYQDDLDADQAPALERLILDPEVEERQRSQLLALRAERDAERVSAALDHIAAAARDDDEPLMGLFVAAVEAGCTLGEICGVLRKAWGEYRSPVRI
jgi:methylmalonyl-CoA mutase N-terminal domain/subunit